MKPILVLSLFLLSQYCSAQDYIAYQRTFNRIDDDVLSNNLPMAIQRLDSIYAGYSFIYSKHCVKALQICSKASDSLRADIWLAKAFRQGVPLWMAGKNELMHKALNYKNTQHTVRSYDSLHTVYKTSINQSLSATIDELLEEDQMYTRRVNDGFILVRHSLFFSQWLRNNKIQFFALNDITDLYGYPGERVIGLSSDYEDSSKIRNFHFWHRVITDERAEVMLIHYYSYGDRDMKDKLLTAVKNGNMPPIQMGTLLDYQQSYGWDKGKHQYYYVWWLHEINEDMDIINRRRDSIGLNTIAQMKRNQTLELERRKNKTSNKEIILE